MKMSLPIKTAALAGLTACATLAAPAHAAPAYGWQFNPRLCPDLVEDRLDQRVTLSRRDLREDVRDARRLNCPASAWTYVAAPGVAVATIPTVYTGPRAVYVGRAGYYQYPSRRFFRRGSPVRINIVVR
ncbi:MAG: hypothetical protein AAF950_04380 [Pseudomonadota bacterium]